MGKFVGRLIRDELKAGGAGGADGTPKARPAFRYRDKGIMATIGTHRAVADIRGWRFGGLFAWIAWSLIHVMFLVGFRNRFFVMAGWIYDYLAQAREARLITGAFKMRITDPRRSGHVHLEPTAVPLERAVG